MVINLTNEELILVLTALRKLPMEVVEELVNNIRLQFQQAQRPDVQDT